MRWPAVPLKTTDGAFVTSDTSSLDLEVILAPDQQQVRCTVEDVAIAFPDRNEDSKLLEIRLGKVEFLQRDGGIPSIDVSDIGTTFFGFLKLLEDLQNAVKFADGAPAIDASDRGVTATFDLPVPDLTTGGFQLTGLSFRGVIDVPFDERPFTIGLAFARREDPFNVSILALGGGGYVDIVLDKTGLRRLEIALEFGASLEVDFVVATRRGPRHGRDLRRRDNGFSLAGYLRFGGMVEVLGLVSVSVELLVTLTYDERRPQRDGRPGHAGARARPAAVQRQRRARQRRMAAVGETPAPRCSHCPLRLASSRCDLDPGVLLDPFLGRPRGAPSDVDPERLARLSRGLRPGGHGMSELIWIPVPAGRVRTASPCLAW